MDKKKSNGSVEIDSVVADFLAESRELLRNMETSLLGLESQPDDPDAIGAIFRAAHTIKGNAGLFGFDDVVAFTHVVEGVLDEVRSGEIEVNDELIALLLSCGDHIAEKLEHVVRSAAEIDEDHSYTSVTLSTRLKTFLPQRSDVNRDPAPAPAEVPVESERQVQSQNWHISIRMGIDSLRNGMDPLSILNYLGTLGDIEQLMTLTDAIPDGDEMDPESCYLGFEVEFKSSATKEQIDSAFKFIREDSSVHILPPKSKITGYINLINSLPEAKSKIGEILVDSGALTPDELNEALLLQSCGAGVVAGECSNAGGESCSTKPGVECQKPAPLGEILVESRMVHPEVVEAALKKQQRTRESSNSEAQYIRIRADKLDSLINRVGELVIAGASANLLARRAGDAALQESTSVISRLVEEIREDALTLRMVQIGETFNRFHRVVRDVSKELGKDVSLIITGADTELDKTVVEKISDPLTHLVRNAMDHGIENGEMRRVSGKPEQGTLRLNAYHDSGSIVIEVADDGRGLDKDRILQKAIERGLVTGSEAMTETDIYNLIFAPGFSTAEQVTNLSGRGVGMDVVRRNIEALRGTVELDATPGRGTTVRIRLPLTLAIIDGFLVGVGANSYVIPLDSVVECIELKYADYEVGAERGYVNLRGQVLPCLHLREHFHLDRNEHRRENVVVVNHGGHKAGFVVDELHGEFQTVIKPLGRLFSGLRGISGSTILGSGDVALIVDVAALIQKAIGGDGAIGKSQAVRRPAVTH